MIQGQSSISWWRRLHGGPLTSTQLLWYQEICVRRSCPFWPNGDVLLWCFAVMFCCDVLLWCFVVMFYSDALLWCFVVMFCCDVLLWYFAVIFCCDVLLWCLAMIFCWVCVRKWEEDDPPCSEETKLTASPWQRRRCAHSALRARAPGQELHGRRSPPQTLLTRWMSTPPVPLPPPRPHSVPKSEDKAEMALFWQQSRHLDGTQVAAGQSYRGRLSGSVPSIKGLASISVSMREGTTFRVIWSVEAVMSLCFFYIFIGPV